MDVTTLYQADTIPANPIPFNTSQRQQLLIVSGSMYFSGTDGTAEIDVFVDGIALGELKIFQNGGPRHLTFPTRHFKLLLSPGRHELRFQSKPATSSDLNDQFNVVLLEF